MRVWLLKTEPQECSIEHIRCARDGIMRWDGIRNYQARNRLRDEVTEGDRCLIYHSGVREPAIVGSATVVRSAYPDPLQFDAASPLFDVRASATQPRWVCIDIRYCEQFPRPLSLAAIKRHAGLASMCLLRQGRLSVQPVSADEWHLIGQICGAGST